MYTLTAVPAFLKIPSEFKVPYRVSALQVNIDYVQVLDQYKQLQHLLYKYMINGQMNIRH